MAVNYATNNFKQEEHTGAAVPLFGNSEAWGGYRRSFSNRRFSRSPGTILGFESWRRSKATD